MKMDEELLPCPFCSRQPAPYHKGVGCVTTGCVLSGLHLDYNKWQARASLPVGVPDVSKFKDQVLELIGDECKYWQHRDEARRGGFAILYAKVNELAQHQRIVAALSGGVACEY